MFAAFAAISNAAIVINVPNGDGYSTGTGTAVIDKASLADFSVFAGNGTGSVSGSFTFMSTVSTIVQVDAQVKTNGISLGSLSFSGAIASPTTSVLSRAGSEQFGNETQLDTAYQTTSLNLAANTLYTLNWSSSYLGTDANSYGYITQAVFVFKEAGTQPVPEPASIAAMGIGLAGIVARRRKGTK